MTAFGPDRADEILATCRSAEAAIGGAFSDAFEGKYQIQAAQAQFSKLDVEALPANLDGAGLIFGISVDETMGLAVLSKTDGLLPEWWTEPDTDGDRKLDQLAHALTNAILPPDFKSQPTLVKFDPDLAATIRDAQPTAESVCLALEINKGDRVAHLILVWPVTRFAGPLQSKESETAEVTNGADEQSQTAKHAMGDEQKGPRGNGQAAPAKLPKHRRLIYRNLEDGIRQLPAYAQSLLRVQVPVTVTLAEAKTPVSRILDMGPGTILQFKKACDSNLTMEVGRQTVAEGEAVKVGDKFGLWITTMTMPSERFWSVNKTASVKRVK